MKPIKYLTAALVASAILGPAGSAFRHPMAAAEMTGQPNSPDDSAESRQSEQHHPAPAPIDDIWASFSPDCAGVILNWSHVAPAGTHHYHIWRAVGNIAGGYVLWHDTSDDSEPLATTWTDVGVGSDSFSYFYTVDSVDINGDAATAQQLVAAKLSYPLELGWNLLSFPVDQRDSDDEDIVRVLKCVHWDVAQYYDATDPVDHWKTYSAYKPPFLNDLQFLNHRMGFWLNTNGPDVDWAIAGTVPVVTDISVYAGWNMIGYPYFGPPKTVDDLRTDCPELVQIEGFDPSYPYNIRPLLGDEVLKHGNGYWVYSVCDAICTVENAITGGRDDCNENGIRDADEVAHGTSDDCDGNGTPDECDVAECVDEPGCGDCNGNGVPDGCEIAVCGEDHGCADCTGNGVPDECDIAQGTSADDNVNGIPDECEMGACCVNAMTCADLLRPDECQALGGASREARSLCPTQNVGASYRAGPNEVVVHWTEAARNCYAMGGPGGRSECTEAIDAWVSAARRDCCDAHAYAGCDDVACEAAVCAVQASCCSGVWHEECAVLAATECGDLCDAHPICYRFGEAYAPYLPPVAAGFFGPGSDPFGSPVAREVCVCGEPVGQTPYGYYEVADMLIRRDVLVGEPFDRCELSSGEARMVDIEIVALNLKSTAPITVTYNGGQDPEQWDVAVGLSMVPPANQSTLTAYKTHCNGGTYDTELYVQGQFTFSKVGHPGVVRKLDTGLAWLEAIPLAQNVDNWVADLDANMSLDADSWCTAFHPGIEDLDTTTECDCNGNGIRDKCDIENCPEGDVSCHDCNNNGLPDGCESDADGDGVPDDCDVCPGGDDTIDTDGDGVPDDCDVCPGGDDTIDSDGDGVPDDCDVCPGGDDSADADGDGVPDYCDPCPNDNPDDPDGDGVCTSTDNCSMPNPGQGDCQPNGVGDVCEIADGTSSDVNDNDVPDECEMEIVDDCAFPLYHDYDYGLATADVDFSDSEPGLGEIVTITANIHNYGVCHADSAWGWYSPDGRSCWGEWDFEYPTSGVVDVSYRSVDFDADEGVDWRIELDGKHIADVHVPKSSDGCWKLVTIHDVPIEAGQHTLFLGTYQMDFYPDYRVDWLKVGDVHIEAETYDRMGGNAPEPDWQGLTIWPRCCIECPEREQLVPLTVQIWDGDPSSGGSLVCEDCVGRTNTVIDSNHSCPGNTLEAYYIENGGQASLQCDWVPTCGGARDIYVVVDPDPDGYEPHGVLEEIDEANNIASKTIGVTDVDIGLVVGRIESGIDSTETLPESDPAVTAGDSFVVEVWATDSGEENTGLAGVFLDLAFDPGLVQASSIDHREPFTFLAGGVIDNVTGTITALGGVDDGFTCVGVEPEWVRLAVVKFEVLETLATAEFATGPSDLEIGACYRGVVPSERISCGTAAVDIEHNVYDLDGDCFINSGDLGLFAVCWACCEGEPCWDANACEEKDFDCSGCVAAGDLGWFAAGWLKACDEIPREDWPPCRRPEGGSRGASSTERGTVASRAVVYSDRLGAAVGPGPAADNVLIRWDIVGTQEAGARLPKPGALNAGYPAGDQFDIELRARDDTINSRGLTAVFVDVRFDPSEVAVNDIEHGSTYTTFASGTIGRHSISRLGGASLDPGVAVGVWTQFAVVRMTALVDLPGGPQLEVRPAYDGVAGLGRGTVPDDQIRVIGETQDFSPAE